MRLGELTGPPGKEAFASSRWEADTVPVGVWWCGQSTTVRTSLASHAPPPLSEAGTHAYLGSLGKRGAPVTQTERDEGGLFRVFGVC